jgi:DNA polymerase V
MEVIKPQYKRVSVKPLPASYETGFQSPAHDYRVKSLSLDELLIRSPYATFFVRVEQSEIEGIERDDLLVVNRAHPLMEGRVAVVVIDGEFALRRLQRQGQSWYLKTDASPLLHKVDSSIICWGIVDASIRTHWT